MYPFSVGLIRDRYLGSYLTSNYSMYLVVVSIRERELPRLQPSRWNIAAIET
jgi:hypothetical protein